MRQHGVRREGVRQGGGVPLYVGEYLAGLLRERSISAEQLAASDLSPELIGSLLTGEQILTADLALALADFFELSPLLLLEVQSRYCVDARDHDYQALRVMRDTLAV